MTTPHNPEAPEVIVAEAIPAAAGSAAAVPVTVRHRGRRPARIRVTVFGLDSRWVPQPLDLGILQPGDSAAIKLSILPERGALGARYPFTIAAEASAADGRARPVVGVAESVLALDAAERISMAIVPSTPSGAFSKGFRVEITNPGDAARTFTLVPDSATGIRARLAASTVTVPPERTVAVKGRVHVKKPTFFGGHNTHTFTVAAQGTGAPEWAEATMRSKPLVGRGITAVVGLILVVALWATLAIVFIPKISNAFKPKNEASVSSTVQGPGSGDGSSSGSPGGSSEGSPEGNGSGNGSGNGNGSGTGNGTGNGASPAGGYQLSGTVTGSGANGATVTLTPVSLASAGDDGTLPAAQTVGENPNALRGQSRAFATAAPQEDPVGKIPGPLAGVAPGGFRTTTILTTDKGEFAFSGVTAPGYYLLTVAKAGYQTQRFLINSVTLASPQPLKVELQPGAGKLSGTVTGPGGAPLGAATIVVTDGTVTLQTSSVSASTHSGTPGTWTMDQVSTPGTYLVTASSPGLGAASTLVTLDASGTATVNLTLHAGQASITGKVSGADSLGNVGGLGGITVTATGGDVTRTTTTVTSAAMRGAYVLPNLPTPGTYTIAITGPGFLAQTREVTLAAGSGNVVIDATLSRADAVVTGRVTGLDANGKAEGGLGGVGLTLASNDITLKTVSTSGATAGSFQFTGVAPGSYVLTAVQFGRTAASATVEVKASATQTVNLVLKADIGAELPATAHIRGQVADSRTGGPLTCDRALKTVAASDCVATVTVTAPKDPADESKGTVTYTTQATAALNFVYTIPDLDDPDHAGLPPGLYTVTVSAPGYEDTITHVQVAQGQTMPAPPASMPALGIISGTVTTRVDKPAKASCVLAVPDGVTLPKTLPTSCTVSTDGNTCTATGITGAQPCALTSMGGANEGPLGTFQVRGLTHGRYQMVLISQDPEYVYTVGAVPIVTLELGADGQFNAVLDRLGRINVSVVKVDAQSGSLIPVAGVAVTATKTAGNGIATPTPVTTDASGTAILKGLDGTYKVTATFNDNGQVITVDTTADPTGLNQSVPVTLYLAKQSGPLVGRVVTDGGGTVPTPVGGVVATVNGVVGYQGATASVGSAKVTTKSNGCYAIVPATWVADDNPLLKAPGCPAGIFTAADSVANGAVAVLNNLVTGQPATLISDRIDASVAPLANAGGGNWTEQFPVTGMGVADCPSAGDCGTNGRMIPDINVKASGMTLPTLTLYIDGPAGFTTPSINSLHINVLSKPSATAGITLAPLGGWGSIPPSPYSQYSNFLNFTDTQYAGTSGKAMPGRYKFQVLLNDFVTTDIDLVCRFQGSCFFADPSAADPTSGNPYFTMNRLPAISVDLTGLATTTDWTKALVTQSSGPSLGNVAITGTSSDGYLTFGGAQTKVVAANTSYAFSVTVPGYGTSPISVTCGADYTATAPNDCIYSGGLTALPDFPTTTLALNPDTVPVTGGATLSTATVTGTVNPNPGASITVAVDANGAVTWKDTRAGVQPGQVMPGDYTITFHRAGFADTNAYLHCVSNADCALYAESTHATEITTVTMPMLPRPSLSVKVNLPSGTGLAAGDPFDLSHSTLTVYRVTGGSEAKVSTASLSLSQGTVDTGGATASAGVSWLDTAQPFAGIAGLATYRVAVTVDGFAADSITGIDCTSVTASCTGTVTLDSNPAASNLTVTKLPDTAIPVQFVVTGPSGAPTVSLTDDGAGNLTWQQGNSLPNVITPGAYKITATLAGYESTVNNGTTTAATTLIDFACTTTCAFPKIVMTKATTLNIKFSDTSVKNVSFTLKRAGTTIDSPTTTNGTATFADRSTSTLTTTATATTDWADGSYTLGVKAAGYAFAIDTSALGSASTAAVKCVNGGSTIDGLWLLPGGTTTCTIDVTKLTKLGSITGTTTWQKNDLTGGLITDEARGGVTVKATLIAVPAGASMPSPIPSFTVTSATTASGSTDVGDFAISGDTTAAGLTAGTWKIEATDTQSPNGFNAFTGVVDVVESGGAYSLAATDPSEQTAIPHLTVSSQAINIVLVPKTVTLDLLFKAGGAQIAVPNVTATLTDGATHSWKCTVSSGVATADPSAPTPVCSLTATSASGKIHFIALPPGTYNLSMTFAGGQYNAVTNYTAIVLPSGVAQELPFTLDAQAGTVSGALVDSTNTAIASFPAGAATIDLFKWNCIPLGDTTCVANKFDTNPATTTTATSTFTLDDLPSGDYQIRVTAPGYAVKWSNYIKVTVGSPTPPPTIMLLPAQAASVKIKILDGSGTALTAGTAKLVPVSSPYQPANTDSSSGSIGTDGVVSFNQLPTGVYSVEVTGQTSAPYKSVAKTNLDLSTTADGATVDLTTSATDSFTLNQASVTLTVGFTANVCAAAPETSSVPVQIAIKVSPLDWKTLANATGSNHGAATTSVLLPPGTYTWGPTSAPTGWTAPSTTPSFKVASDLSVTADGGTTGTTVALTSTATPNFTATLTVDGGVYENATITASAAGQTDITATTDGDGEAPMCLTGSTSGIEWHINPNDASATTPVVGFDDVKVTVTDTGPDSSAHTFKGYTLKPAADLASTAPADDSVTADISISGSVLTADGQTVTKDDGWTGGSIIVPAGTYTLTATPDPTATGAGYGVGVGTAVTVGSTTTSSTAISATIPYTAPAPATVALNLTLTTSDSSAIAQGTQVKLKDNATPTPNEFTESTTDESGAVSITGLAPSTTYTVTITGYTGTVTTGTADGSQSITLAKN